MWCIPCLVVMFVEIAIVGIAVLLAVRWIME
jgi:hypothetical protein